jgi:eukaryotic-like serine/threonine-protein kinase
MSETLGHYRLRERLGAGAMGEVWLAEDTRLHRAVALKMLPARSAGDGAAAARLLREARVASVLNHPNVAVIYEVGEAGDGTRFIAMEHVRGRTLAELAREGRLASATVLEIARQVAEALAAAHEAGIVHGDVKPGNVMVGERGQVKVLDFGLARFAPPVDDQSATWSGDHGALAGALAGTLAYMSPEQARGRPVDGRSDLFSLGVVLYELLAGERPFQGESAIDLIDAILHAAPASWLAEGPLEEGLARLVWRLLEKEPSRRPARTREVCAELDAIAAGQVAPPRPPERTLAVLGFVNVTGRPEDAWLGAGLAETIAAGLAALPQVGVLARERIVEAARALGVSEDAEGEHAARLGRELGAHTVVTGAFQSAGEQVRVTARAAEAASGRVLLTIKEDGRRGDIFGLQDRIVAGLAAGLRGQLPEPARAHDDTHSLEAYEAYSKGLVNLVAESQESLDRAIAFFERAIALDPGYARAHVQLGAALDSKGDYLGMPEISARALVTLEQGIALRPDDADAWRRKGGALITLGRAEEALAAFELSLSLDPTLDGSHAGIGRVHFVLRGDFARALPAFERALALNPRAGWSALQLANCAVYLRDFARAERAARLAIELQQSLLSGQRGLVIVGGFVRLGQSHALQGRPREALLEYARELEFLKTIDHALRARIFIELHQRIGEAHLRLGEEAHGLAALDLALEAFERRVRAGAAEPATPYYAACAHALRGEREPALDRLETAAAHRPLLTAARAPLEPALESLRELPRFRAIVNRGSGAGG